MFVSKLSKAYLPRNSRKGHVNSFFFLPGLLSQHTLEKTNFSSSSTDMIFLKDFYNSKSKVHKVCDFPGKGKEGII